MATSYTLSLLLNAVDKASAPIKAVITGLGDLGKAAQQAIAGTSKVGEQGSTHMDRFSASIKQARDNMEALSASAAKIAQVSGELLMVGASLSAAFLFPVSQAAAFELAMAKVQAVSDATTDEYKALAAAAEHLGLVTKFTGTQVAEGMGELAQAGLKANQIIMAMPPIIALATAGMISLAEATDITVSVMFGMQLGVMDLQHVTDVLARTAVDTNVNIHELGESLKYAASSAAAAGVSVEETTAAIGVLGNVGIKASMAGTVIRGMLTKIADPSKEAKDALAGLGVELLDSEGKMRNFTSIVADLGKAGMTLQDAAKIFDTRGATGAIALTKNIDKLRELTRANEEAFGSTAKMAETIQNTISGAWVNFKATIEAFSMAVVGPMAGAIKVLIDTINVMLQAVVAFIKAIDPLAGIVLMFIGVLGGLLTIAGLLGLAFAGLLKVFGLLALAMGSVSTAATAGVAATGSLAVGFATLKAMASGLIGVVVGLGRALFLMAPPWLLALTAIAGVGYALYRFIVPAAKTTKELNSLAASTMKSREAFDSMAKQLSALTPGTMQHEEALVGLIKAYPELADKIRLTGQAWSEQEEILKSYRKELQVKEIGALGGAMQGNMAALTAGPTKGALTGWQELRKAMGGLTGMAGAAMFATGWEDFKTKWKAAINWVSAYHTERSHVNRQEYEATLTLMTNQFRQLGEAMGIAPEQFAKMSTEAFKELFDSNENGMELFRANWILAKGDQDSFVASALAAQKKIQDSLKAPDGEEKTPIQKMITEAQAGISAMHGLSAAQKADFRNLMTFMEENLTSQPVAVQVAWLAAIKKITEEYGKIGNKTPEIIAQLKAALAGLNIQTIAGQLPGVGPTATPIAGTEGLTYKGGANINAIRKAQGDQLANLIGSTVEEASRRLGIDPAVVFAIMSHETGGSFKPTSFNPGGGGLGASGLGQFRSGTAQMVLKRMGMGALTGEEAAAKAMDPEIASKMVPEYVRQIQEQLQAEGKKADLWSILFAYRGGSAISAEMFKAYYEDVTRRIVGFQKDGGVEFYTEQQLKLDKQRVDENLANVKAMQSKQLVGATAALDQEKQLTLERSLVNQKDILNQMEVAKKDNNSKTYQDLQTRLTQERMASAQSMKMLGLEEVAHRRAVGDALTTQAIKEAEDKVKIAEDASKRQESIWNLEKAQLGAAYAARSITAMQYYSSIKDVTDREYAAEKAKIDKRVADEKAIWDAKTAQKVKAAENLDAVDKALALRQAELEAAAGMRPILTEQLNYQNKINEALAKKGELLAKQKEDQIERPVLEKEWSNMEGPLKEQQAKLMKLKYDQAREARAYDDYLQQQVTARQEWIDKGSKGPMYGMSPEEAEAWRIRMYASQQIQMKNAEFGEEAKRWAGVVTSGINSLVDSLMEGGADLRKSLNTFFKSIFKASLEPGMKALTEYLQQAFKELFGQIGIGLANCLMGLIGLVGMLLSGGKKSSFTASAKLESGVTTSEATRGMIAGETSIPIAQISLSLEEAMSPHLSVLRQIENNTRGGTAPAAAASEGGGGGVNVQLIVQGVTASVKDAMDEYFSRYLMMGAK